MKVIRKMDTRALVYMFIVALLFVVMYIFMQPLIVLYGAWHETNFSEKYLRQSLPYGTDISGFAGLPDINRGDQLIGQAANEQNCERGFYMGQMEMTEVDCTTVCNATSSGQFVYKYIRDNNVVIDNQYLKRGGWCLPTSLAYCNLNISVAVKSLGRYECISKYPQLLGGPYGNDIVGCAPSYEFNDNLKKLTYTNVVPTTLAIADINERLIGSDEYRYTCNTRNGHFATFAERPELGNRFQLFYDSCNFFDGGGHIVKDRCSCSHALDQETTTTIVKPLMPGQRDNTVEICSQCTSGYEIIDERSPQYGSRYGVSIGINCVDPEFIEYYKTQYIEMNGVLPCGFKNLLRIRENSNQPKYGCHRALLNVTNTYTPEMLQRING